VCVAVAAALHATAFYCVHTWSIGNTSTRSVRRVSTPRVALSSFLFLFYAAHSNVACSIILCHSPPRHHSPERTRPRSARWCHARLGCSLARSPPQDDQRATPPSLPPSLPRNALHVPLCHQSGAQQRQLPKRRARLPPSLLSLPRSLTSIHPETMTIAWLRQKIGGDGFRSEASLPPPSSSGSAPPPPPPPLLLLPLDLWDVMVTRVPASSLFSPCVALGLD
jgi:hypothetical protein